MAQLPLYSILQSQGLGTRKDCQKLIHRGYVTINGQLVQKDAEKYETEGFIFQVDDEEFLYRKHIYIAMNKASGVECSRESTHHVGIMNVLPRWFGTRGVQPAGRLDQDTTGLILLSDDGAFIHALSSPKRHVNKCYHVTTTEPVTEAQINLLLSGVMLKGEHEPTRAISCEQISPQVLAMVIDQGKYHQVKRMMAAVGNHCVALNRVSVGALTLSELNLAEGDWCYLTEAQLEQLTR